MLDHHFEEPIPVSRSHLHLHRPRLTSDIKIIAFVSVIGLNEVHPLQIDIRIPDLYDPHTPPCYPLSRVKENVSGYGLISQYVHCDGEKREPYGRVTPPSVALTWFRLRRGLHAFRISIVPISAYGKIRQNDRHDSRIPSTAFRAHH